MEMRNVIALLALAGLTAAFSGGPPEDACNTMMPDHGKAPSRRDCPFVMVGMGWIPGEFVRFGIFPLEENSKDIFRGFLASVYHNGQSIGTMKTTVSDGRRNDPPAAEIQLRCGGKSIAHADPTKKEEVFFEWKAPADLDTNAQLVMNLTIVQRKANFWVNCNPEPYLSKIQEGLTTSSTAEPQPSTAAPEPTQAPTERPVDPTERPVDPTEPAVDPTEPAVDPTEPSVDVGATQRPSRGTRPPRPEPVPETERPVASTEPAVDPTESSVDITSTQRPSRGTRPPRPAPVPEVPVDVTPEIPERAVDPREPAVEPTPRPTRSRGTRPPRPAPVTTKPVPERRRPQVVTRNKAPVDSYLDYQNKAELKHETKSSTECVEQGNTYRILPGSSCVEFEQTWGTNSRTTYKCSRGSRFDPRVCSCAQTLYCPDGQ